jgi:hypothetical protein
MVLLASSYDQSRFLRAEDVTRETTLKIKNVTEETFGEGKEQKQKLVLWFTNTKKGLVLNRTNNRTIRAAYGDNTAGWAGKLVVVFPTQAEYRGRMGPALRVRIPPPKQASGNGQPAQLKTAQDTLEVFGRPTPEPDPDLDDTLDDVF